MLTHITGWICCDYLLPFPNLRPGVDIRRTAYSRLRRAADANAVQGHVLSPQPKFRSLAMIQSIGGSPTISLAWHRKMYGVSFLILILGAHVRLILVATIFTYGRSASFVEGEVHSSLVILEVGAHWQGLARLQCRQLNAL
jgi:hypothetical protein